MALRPISRVEGYEFPAEAWDVRGWTVRTEAEDEKVGKVEDMLLDSSGSLRYLDVDLGFGRKHVLVPLDHAYADSAHETVRIEGMSKDDLDRVPEYAVDPESLDEGYERQLAAVYGARHRAKDAPPPKKDAGDDPDLGLRRMDALEGDYQVAGTDPRGWDVVTADGGKVGEVSELLMDPGAMKARFLDVAVDEKRLELEPVERHILLPAERVRLERDKKRVVVGGLLTSDVARYPHYSGLPVRARTARELENFFERAGTEQPVDRKADWAETGPADSAARHFYRAAPGTGPETTREGYHG